MVKGQAVTLKYLITEIENKNFSKNRMDAYRKFGTNFVEISPIPNSVFIEDSKSIFVKKPNYA